MGHEGRADALLVTEDGVARVQEALRAAGLDGWLLYEFHGKNDVAWDLLGLAWTTRRSFVLVPARGRPTALIHAIEPSSWRHWPWETVAYAGWREMESRLASLLAGHRRLAMEVSRGRGTPVPTPPRSMRSWDSLARRRPSPLARNYPQGQVIRWPTAQ